MPDQRSPRRPRLMTPDGEPVALPDRPDQDGPYPPSLPLGLWWSLNRPDGGGVHIQVIEEDGRWVITDVYAHGPGLTATDLQSVPLTQLDLIMNLVGYWDESHGGGIMDPSVIEEVHNEFAAKAGYGSAVTYDPEADEPSLAELRDLAADAPPELPQGPTPERPRLTRPDGTDPDGFYALVAEAYREYAPHTRAPSVKIAEEAGVPVGTVRGWVREARRRGKLPTGRKGKVG